MTLVLPTISRLESFQPGGNLAMHGTTTHLWMLDKNRTAAGILQEVCDVCGIDVLDVAGPTAPQHLSFKAVL